MCYIDGQKNKYSVVNVVTLTDKRTNIQWCMCYIGGQKNKYSVWMCYIDGKKNKYSVVNVLHWRTKEQIFSGECVTLTDKRTNIDSKSSRTSKKKAITKTPANMYGHQIQYVIIVVVALVIKD
jgi:hypothetical protein